MKYFHFELSKTEEARPTVLIMAIRSKRRCVNEQPEAANSKTEHDLLLPLRILPVPSSNWSTRSGRLVREISVWTPKVTCLTSPLGGPMEKGVVIWSLATEVGTGGARDSSVEWPLDDDEGCWSSTLTVTSLLTTVPTVSRAVDGAEVTALQ